MEKNTEDWREVMKGEQGLSGLHNLFFEKMDELVVSQEKESEVKKYIKEHFHLEHSDVEHSVSLAEVDTEQSDRYAWIDLSEKGLVRPLIVCMTKDDSAEDVYRMLETGAFLSILSNGLVKTSGFDEWSFSRLPRQKALAYSKSLDLSGPKTILIDNIQTVMDVYRVATHRTRSVENDLVQFDALTNPDQGTDIDGETQIERCARAPFGFWAETRKVIPVSVQGESVLSDQGGFSLTFLNVLKNGRVTREDPLTDFGIRHGGCPELHPDVKNDNHINKMGQLFTKWYTYLNK